MTIKFSGRIISVTVNPKVVPKGTAATLDISYDVICTGIGNLGTAWFVQTNVYDESGKLVGSYADQRVVGLFTDSDEDQNLISINVACPAYSQNYHIQVLGQLGFGPILEQTPQFVADMYVPILVQGSTSIPSPIPSGSGSPDSTQGITPTGASPAPAPLPSSGSAPASPVTAPAPTPNLDSGSGTSQTTSSNLWIYLVMAVLIIGAGVVAYFIWRK